ncbi:MAG: DNA-directed RNA polymerase subunit N [Rhizobiales bacterium 62-47]|nr:DNA-directed RNA polymerase subunit N [Hyphomicrobiales bacterium]OJY12944.1 MAG: DNA-directed RNA polymerase subunit N [Rhizobiales bacterium 62-47]
MHKIVAVAAVTMALLSSAAEAQERAGDAALGALSGAVVLGPIGAVAGAVVGYTAGPSIARSWGLRRSSSKPPRRSAKRADQRVTTVSDSRRAVSGPAAAPKAAAAPPPVEAGPRLPPVQALD